VGRKANALAVEKPLADGRSTVFPPEHAKSIWRISWLCLVSFAVAAWGCPYLSPIPATVLFTSLNYWRRPGPGYRRVVDIAAVHIGAATCIWYSFETDWPYFIGYWTCTWAGILCYYVGCSVGSSNLKLAVRMHMSLHAMANVGNWVLFVGLRPENRLSGYVGLLRVVFLGAGVILAGVYNIVPPSMSHAVLFTAPGVIASILVLRGVDPGLFDA